MNNWEEARVALAMRRLRRDVMKGRKKADTMGHRALIVIASLALSAIATALGGLLLG